MYNKLDLETIAFDTQCIANLFQLIADYGKEGANGLDNYTDAIYLASDIAIKNAKKLDEITQYILHQK